VGDSIVRKLDGKLKGKQVEIVTMPGCTLDVVADKVLNSVKKLKVNGCLIVQGGGNGLQDLGLEGSKKVILALVEKLKVLFPSLKIAYIPISPRNMDAEKQGYDEIRKEFNRSIRPELYRRGLNTIELGEGSHWEMFLCRDGVHFSYKGMAALIRECNRWIGVMLEGYRAL
jgi:lysophospholipase L1-like esterase